MTRSLLKRSLLPVALLLAILGMGRPACAADPIPWLPSYEAALAQAKTAHTLILVYLTTDSATKLDADVNPNAAVLTAAARFAPVKVDAENEGKALAAKYSVDRYPTILCLDTDGAVIGEIHGDNSADDLAKDLNHIADEDALFPTLQAKVKANPKDMDATLELAQIDADRGRAADALALAAVLEKNGRADDLPALYNQIGAGLRDRGKYEYALTDYRHAITLSPKPNDLLEARIGIVICLIRLQKRDDAKTVIKDILAMPGLPDALKQRFQGILDDLNSQSDAGPDPQAAAHRTRAGGLESKYDYAAAIAEYQQAYDLDKTVHLKDATLDLNKIGSCYFRMSLYPKALEFFGQELPLRRQVGDKEGEATTLSNIGLVYENLSQYDKALDYYGQALPLRRQVGDKEGEAATLNGIGIVYRHLSQYDKALDYYGQALPIERQVGDKSDEADTLSNIGLVYENLSQYDKALDYYGQALPLRRQVGDKEGEAATLNGIGAVYDKLSQYNKALDFFQQALPIERQIGNKADEATTLGNIGSAYEDLSRYDEALNFFEQALTIHQQVEDREGEATALGNIGGVYDDLSRHDKALDFYQQSLLINRQIGDKEGEATALGNIGSAYEDLSQYAKALDFDQQALTIEQQIGNKANEADLLSNIGSVYSDLSQYVKSLDFDQQALPLRRQVGDKSGEAATLSNIGAVYLELSQYPRALDCFQQVLPIERQIGNKAGEATILNNLMYTSDEIKQPGAAIFYGKQAVNLKQAIRADIMALDKESRKSYLAANAYTYRNLADLLISQGRLPEAQQVLGLLKEDEYFEFVRRDPAQAPAGGVLALTPQEAPWEARYRQIADHITALGAEQGALQDTLKLQAKAGGTPSAPDLKHLAALNSDLGIAKQAFNRFLTELNTTAFVDTKDSHVSAASLQEAVGLESDLRQMGQGAVALYTLVGKDKYRVLLVTPDTQKAEEYPITAADLNKKVLAFRQALQDPQADPKPLAQELYKILFCDGKLAQDLEGAKAQTLMWSLDGTLRYLPVAALHDGTQYLVEKYRNVVFTPASNARLKDPVSPKWTALGLGVSKKHRVTLTGAEAGAGDQSSDFPALPGVVSELNGIIQGKGGTASGGVLPGAVELDEDFTQSAMQTALQLGSYPLVHIASHFRFVPGDETASYLLLGDGTPLSLAQINSLPNLFNGVELLTLSACNTANGASGADGKEVEGFGVLAQREGAEAVLASLWEVADASTPLLMEEFYKRREAVPGTSKADALQQAQIALLHGSGGGSGGGPKSRAVESVSAPGVPTASPAFVPDPNAPYAHPYYWAPFILIGNWK